MEQESKINISAVRILTYDESFLDDQVRIGQSVIDGKYPFIGQSSKKLLLHQYRGENFNPELKLYAFLDNEMIGFVTSKKSDKHPENSRIAFLEFPIVLPKFDNVKFLLMDKILVQIKGMGFQKILTRVSKHWPGSLDMVEKYNYTFDHDLIQGIRIDIEHIKIQNNTNCFEGEIIDFDFTKHEDLFREFHGRYYKWDEHTINGVFNNYSTNENIKLFSLYLRDGRIEGLFFLTHPPQVPELLSFSDMVSLNDPTHSIKSYFLKQAIKIAKDMDIIKFAISLWPLRNPESKEFYNHSGIEFPENQDILSYYSLEI